MIPPRETGILTNEDHAERGEPMNEYEAVLQIQPVGVSEEFATESRRECLKRLALWGSGSWGVVNTNSKHIPPVRPFRRPEAVGYPHIEPAVGVPSGCDTGNEEL